MKTIVILILALIVLPGFSQDSLYNVQFYAYTPKIISISSNFQKFNDAFYKQNDVYDNQVRIDYYYTTSMDLFLPFYHNNDIGFSIINETRFKQRNNFISLNDTESFNSNQINSFVKAVKKFRLKNNNTIVLAGQVNYYGHNIINCQKTGGSLTGIIYTKNNTTTSVGYGITYDMNYHMSPIVPIFIYYKQLAAGYNIEMFLPWKIGVQTIVNPKTYLYLGSRLDIDLDLIKSENHPYSFNKEIVESRSTHVKTYSSLERSISQNIWLSLEMGYNHNFTSYITDVETVKEAEVDESYMSAKNFGGVYFNIGVFFRPQSPKK